MAGVGRGQLVPRALRGRAGLGGEEAEVVERTEALQRLEPEEIGVAAHGLGEDRLHVPGVGDEDVVGAEGIDGLVEAVADRVGVPGAVAEVEGLGVDR
jgi:hypothetical protein